MTCLVPRMRGNPDDLEFQGPVETMDVLSGWGETIYHLGVTVMRDTTGPEDVPFTLSIFVAEHRLAAGYRPRVGDEVRGVLWLQGARAGV